MNRLYKALMAFSILLLMAALCVPVMAAEEEPVFVGAVYTQCENPVYGQCADIAVEYEVPVFYADPVKFFTSAEDVAKELRACMEDRETSIKVGLRTRRNPSGLSKEILEEALAHTGVPTQGDYLRWQLDRWGANASILYYPSEGVYEITFAYEIDYYSNAKQEAAVDAAVEALLDKLDVDKASSYEKVCAIYEYMCNNITYDYSGLAAGNDDDIYTAYAALIKKSSVCQGYSNLFYRLALELGVDSRIVTGIGNGGPHAWNIVKLGMRYYNLDATWDAPIASIGLDYRFFLRANSTFEDHQRDDEYKTPAFNAAYPMGSEDYIYTKADPEELLGGMDGNAGLTDSDAIYLLRYTLFAANYPIDSDVDKDINCDGSVTDADAIYLLRHTLFATVYPLYPGR